MQYRWRNFLSEASDVRSDELFRRNRIGLRLQSWTSQGNGTIN
jgi:hypothetical protein